MPALLQACIPGKNGGCKNRMLNTALATVICDGGALVAKMAMKAGLSALASPIVVATCDVSAFRDAGSCTLANKATTVTTLGGGNSVTLQSTEWDANCVCARTGRRPAIMITLPQVYTPSTCRK